MKQLKLLWSYLHGVRLISILLILLSFFALRSTVRAVGSARYAYEEYRFIDEAALDDAYYFNRWVDEGSVIDGDPDYTGNPMLANQAYQKFIREIEEMPGVKSVGVQKYMLSDVRDPNAGEDNPPRARIFLYSEGLLELFPTLQKKLPFNDPSAVYLCGNIYGGAKPGDTLEWVNYANVMRSFKVEGYLEKPCNIPDLNGGTSGALSASMLSTTLNENVILMLDTPENEAWLLGDEGMDMMLCCSGFYLTYEKDAAPEEKAAVEKFAARFGSFAPTGDIKQSVVEEKWRILMSVLPRSIFLITLSLITYVSMIVLTISKKRKETAIAYICGGSRRRISLLMTGMLSAVMLIPAMLAMLDIAAARYLDRIGYAVAMYMVLDHVSVLIVLTYCAIAILAAGGIVYALMARHSPITYFKEVTK